MLSRPGTILLVFVLVLAGIAQAKEKPAPNTAYETRVKPLMVKYCYDCHGDGMDKGGLALDAFNTPEEMFAKAQEWQLVIRNIRSGEMPPAKKPQPSAEEREIMAGWVETEVFKTDCDKPDPGRVTIRRLNRNEYNNTIRDLVGVDFQPASDFPMDDVGYGFDNIGDVLSVSPILFEKYLSAAEKVMEEAIQVGGPKLGGETRRLEAEKLKSTADGGPYGNNFAMSLMREGEIFTNINIEKKGEYFIRVRAFGQHAGDEPPKVELRLDGKAVGVKGINALENVPEIFELKLALEPGEKKLAAAYINNFRDPNNPNPDKRDRNLFIDYLEVVGPLAMQPLPLSHQKIFFKTPKEGETAKCARELVGSFAKKAFRRPLKQGELDRLMGLYSLALENGETFEEGVKLALQAVLVSPQFLFRSESQPNPNDPKAVHDVDEYALASRLSYFLWSTMPDDELFALAEKKALRKNLKKQVERMIQSPKSTALVKNFGAQWLQIRNLANVTPAKEVFPEFTPELRDAMGGETEKFFEYVMRENRSVLEFIDADYTFINEKLATLYGMDDVKGPEFRKVSLKGTERGGVLTHASILTITSNPSRTSPVKRGKWVLENLLGTPPPPAPPDVPELNEGKEAALSGTLRERMEQHRQKALCFSCHSRMDPIGFGFENFDGIGRWRNKDGKFDIDPGGELASGEKFETPAELKQILLKTRKDEFLRCLTEKMLTYALGRGVEYYDKCAVDKIVAKLGADDYKFQTLVMEVVKSAPFQKRRGESSSSDSSAVAFAE